MAILTGSSLIAALESSVVSKARRLSSAGMVALAFLIATVVKLPARMARLMADAVIICFFIYLLLLTNFFIPRVVRIMSGSAKISRGGRKSGTTKMLMTAPRASSMQIELTSEALE